MNRSWVNWTAALWPVSAVDLIFPPLCPLCRGELSADSRPPALCDGCQQSISLPLDQLCGACGRQTRGGECLQDNGDGCGACQSEKKRFSRVISLGPHRDGLRTAIVKMKHAGQQSLTAAIGQTLGLRLAEVLSEQLPDALVSVPMHWRRRLLRGEGSSAVLAEAVSRRTRIPIIWKLLACRRRTQKQSTLRPKERTTNVRDAFRVDPGRPIRGLHIAVVDDTMTTGATANEIATTVLAAGARRVTWVVAARAVED